MGFEIIKDGNITTVPGFLAGSAHCGLKSSRKKPDICIIYAPEGAVCSGVFTTNKFQAAPVIIDRKMLARSNKIKALTVNSGIANACTGRDGMDNALKTRSLTADILGIDDEEVLIASTGVIGKQLPMDKIEKGIRDSVSIMGPDGGDAAAKAILTTDLIEKKIAIRVDLCNGKKVTIAGMAKGSGMIEPNMATMLAFLGTDACIEKDVLNRLLREANKTSFNSITVDGCQSTNDTVLLMAGGSSGAEISGNSEEYNEFLEGLSFLMKELAKKIVADGEGATKLIEIKVKGAADDLQAKKAAFKIANSNLFKTAIFGQDLNWGRINAALGSADCDLEPGQVDIYVGDIKIVQEGIGLDIEKNISGKLLKEKDLLFTIDIKKGKGTWTVWTSDLSFDYIKINALYHT